MSGGIYGYMVSLAGYRNGMLMWLVLGQESRDLKRFIEI